MSRDGSNNKDVATLDLVVFKAGQFMFGIESSWIKSSGILPDYVIPEIESLLSLPLAPAKSGRRCLMINSGSDDYEISVAAPVELYKLSVDAIHPLPAVIVARCKLPGLRALAMMDKKILLVIEPHSVPI